MLNQFIQNLRKENGLTQEYISKKLDISRPTYIQIERGKRDITVSEAKKLAGIFDISLNDFLEEKKESKIRLKIDGSDVKNLNQDDPEIRISVPQKNVEKFKEVLLYILSKVGGKPNIGEAVIYKLLYFIDFDFYEKYEEQLIGATYIKNHHGPTPVEFKAIVDRMIKNKEIMKVEKKYFEYPQRKYLPIRMPNLEVLSAREKEHIDNVLIRLSDKNAKEMENYTHEDIPWKTATDGKIISYESVFYRDENYSVRNYEDDL